MFYHWIFRNSFFFCLENNNIFFLSFCVLGKPQIICALVWWQYLYTFIVDMAITNALCFLLFFFNVWWYNGIHLNLYEIRIYGAGMTKLEWDREYTAVVLYFLLLFLLLFFVFCCRRFAFLNPMNEEEVKNSNTRLKWFN